MASGADGTLLVGPLPLQARFGESWWTDETREARYGNLPLRTLSSGLGDHSPQPLRAVVQHSRLRRALEDGRVPYSPQRLARG
jgi:hypothetical protein